MSECTCFTTYDNNGAKTHLCPLHAVTPDSTERAHQDLEIALWKAKAEDLQTLLDWAESCISREQDWEFYAKKADQALWDRVHGN